MAKPKKRKRRQTRYRPPEVLADAAPTDALPGSFEKIEALRGRLERGEALGAGGDVLDDPTRRTAYLRPKNGTDVKLGRTEAVRPDPGERPVVVPARKAGRIADDRSTRREEVLSLAAVPAKMLGERMRRLRQSRKMSLRRVGLYGGSAHSSLLRAEQGRRGRVSYQTVWDLADALGLSLDEVVGRGGVTGWGPRRS